ncbi:hypothetical protein ILYODFUR_034815 [Ilyodon furcidens]|uniref:Secreted protein n=1 Tax=Ilyodon furcidens TaxID=33524 RepID=A0ABV0T2P5_9TELE
MPTTYSTLLGLLAGCWVVKYSCTVASSLFLSWCMCDFSLSHGSVCHHCHLGQAPDYLFHQSHVSLCCFYF